MISVIINSWNEPNSIGKAIKCIADSRYSGIHGDFEVIQVSPDQPTLDKGMEMAKELHLHGKYIQLRDPLKGKPFAFKMALKQAKGDILIMTDGDMYFDKNTVKKLLFPLEQNEKVGGATGRAVSLNPRNTMFGYYSHLLTDSAHNRRSTMLENMGEYHISGKNFFPMSGYIIAARRELINVPETALSDDAYISYEIRNRGYEIAYVPDAIVYLKFPNNFKDYLLQKVRSLGGYIQLKSLGVMKKDKQSRSLLIEMSYAFFVLRYARNFKEIIWSLLLFPIRLYTWLIIFIRRVILKQGMPKKGWERIKTTKFGKDQLS